MKKLRQDNIKRILVRSANWVGDAVTTTPALRAIRKNFPRAHITLLAKPWVAPVFANNPDIDETMIYAAQGKHAGFGGTLRLARELRKKRFDLAVFFPNAFSSALLAFLARVPRRLGYTTDGRSLLLNRRVKIRPEIKNAHMIDYYLGLITGAGLKTAGRKLTIALSAEEKAAAAAFLAQKGLAPGRRLVGLNPGAAFGTAKRWPAERFVELGQRLIEHHNAVVLIMGGPDESELGRDMAIELGLHCINTSGKTPLRQALALIGACDLFVTNDSGLMHVAAALDIPQVVIIGPTDPIATGPANQASCLVQVKDACPLSPCLKPHCPTAHECMTAVTTASVLAAVESTLNQWDR